MSYEAVLEQVKTAPEECLDEISKIISYVVYRYEERKEEEPSPQLANAMLEALQISSDPSEKAYSSTKELFEDLNA